MNGACGLIALLLAAALTACAPVRGGGTEVVSLARQIDRTRPDTDLCSALTLTKAEVATYFSLADEVDPAAFHDEAMILPCSYRGTIQLAGQLYHWEIFAGGAGYLYDGAAVNKRYLCRERCLAALPNLR